MPGLASLESTKISYSKLPVEKRIAVLHPN